MGEINIDRTRMMEILRELFLSIFDKSLTYRTTGVTFSELSSFTPRQLSVFDVPEKVHIHNEKLSSTIMKLKERFEGIMRQGFIPETKKKEEIGILFNVG